MTFQNSDSGSHVSGVPETTLASSFPLGKGNNNIYSCHMAVTRKSHILIVKNQGQCYIYQPPERLKVQLDREF